MKRAAKDTGSLNPWEVTSVRKEWACKGQGHVTIMAAPLSSAFLESEAAVSDKSTDPGYL